MGRKRKAEWKPVPIPEDFKREEMGGLLGLEVLDEYNINDNIIKFSSFGKTKKRNENAVGHSSKRMKKSGDQSIESNNGWNVTPANVNKKLKKKLKIRSKCNKSKSEKGHLHSSIDESRKLNTPKDSTGCASHNDSQVSSGQVESEMKVSEGMEAWSTFKLAPSILQALSQLGFKKPTEIQEKTLHASVTGRRDILGAAETGSGKTLAFGIPIIQGILQQKNALLKIPSSGRNISDKDDLSSEEEEEKFSETYVNSEGKNENFSIVEDEGKKIKKLYALVLTPTRELAIQVKNHISAVAKFADIKVAVIIGGLAPQKQERILRSGPEIIVATPGRLWEMIDKGCQHLQHVSDISFLAIDETDRMLEKGHFEELQKLLNLINADPDKKQERQNFVFSATLTMVHEAPKYIVNKKKSSFLITPGQKLQEIIAALGVSHPKVVDITQEKGTASTLLEARIVCKLEEKDFYLYYFLLRHPGRTLVFCNSIACVRRLTSIFEILQCKPYPLHAKMQQRQRLKNLERFVENPNGLLLASDVAARGLDIPDVQHVIHFQVPMTVESYVHRSGRTARVKKEGLTVLILEPSELTKYLKLCNTLGKGQDIPDFPVEESIFSASRDRVLLALQIDQLEHAMKKDNSDCNWFKKAAIAADVFLDEDEFRLERDDEERANKKRQLIGLRNRLKQLLSQKAIPQRRSLKFVDLNKIKVDATEEAIEAFKNRKKPHVICKLVK